ncbi:hypothetical protein DUI87_09688 [Hirundo rustica rustica]|uniref:Homeobox domain-containing protein n=1 Tax=Hirundo rustica rustica TaxID=333673 RepID=A0A3M0KUY0_HIRRU|nr:hypothetical protein DUI87_09688 [Hirundo rustica rustica]
MELDFGPSPPGASGPRPPCRKRRKSRTAFTAQQLRELEQRFRRQRYLSPVDRDALAARLALSAAQVITWFQNRRAKLKRDLEELRADVASLQALPPRRPAAAGGAARAAGGSRYRHRDHGARRALGGGDRRGGLSRARSAPLGSTLLRSDLRGSIRAGSAELGFTRVRSGRDCSVRIHAAPFGCSRVRSD